MIAILGDEEKRAIYDQTGCAEDAVSDYTDLQNLKLFIILLSI